MNVAQQVVSRLETHGVERVYGLIGTSILDFIDALNDSPIRYVSTRQDQSAVSMAVGEGRVRDQPGIAAVHGGPGFLNSLTAVAVAYKDCVPAIIFTGAVKRRMRGLDSWLEVDQKQIALPIVKSFFRIDKPAGVFQIVDNAFAVSLTPPKGPVVVECSEDMWHLDVPTGILRAQTAVSETVPRASVEQVLHILDLMKRCKAPIIVVGGGLNNQKGSDLLLQFVNRFNIPVIATGNGRGVLSETSKFSLGKTGFPGGSTLADQCLRDSDFVLCLGAELSDSTTYGYNFLPRGEIIRVNLDSIADKKPVPYSISLNCDVISFLEVILDQTQMTSYEISVDWKNKIDQERNNWMSIVKDALTRKYEGFVNPGVFFSVLDEKFKEDTIVAAGQGLHIIYAHSFLRVRKHSSFLAAMNLGAMGYALPAALGAKATAPKRDVIAILGDGEFMMNLQEIETGVREKLGVKIVVVNDNSYRVLLMRQRIQKMGRIKGTLLTNPDFQKLGQSFGVPALSISDDSQIDDAVRFILQESDVPCLVELKISPDDLPPLNVDATLLF